MPKELKIALWVALPFGVIAGALLTWDRLFPVPPERLVEVAWTHQCPCVGHWMDSLRAEGFTIRDYEIDDLSSIRRNWNLPPSSSGCHPATFMGYFLDGHVSAETLRRVAREKPRGSGFVQQTVGLSHDSTEPQNTPDLRTFLVGEDQVARPWQ